MFLCEVSVSHLFSLTTRVLSLMIVEAKPFDAQWTSMGWCHLHWDRIGCAHFIRCTIPTDFFSWPLFSKQCSTLGSFCRNCRSPRVEKRSLCQKWSLLLGQAGISKVAKYYKVLSVAAYVTPCIPDTGLLLLSGLSFPNSRSVSGVSLCVKIRLQFNKHLKPAERLKEIVLPLLIPTQLFLPPPHLSLCWIPAPSHPAALSSAFWWLWSWMHHRWPHLHHRCNILSPFFQLPGLFSQALQAASVLLRTHWLWRQRTCAAYFQVVECLLPITIF